MTLSKWIEREGVSAVAKTLNVHISAVYQWQIGANFPRPENMQRIVHLSKGQVTYENIVTEYLKKNAKLIKSKN